MKFFSASRGLASRSILRTIAFLLVFVVLNFAFPIEYVLNLKVVGFSSQKDNVEFYYSSALPQFDPVDRVGSVRVWENGEQSFLGRIHSSRPISFIRVDPLAAEEDFDLYSIEIQGESGLRLYSGAEIAKEAVLVDQLDLAVSSERVARFSVSGADAKIVLPVPREITRRSKWQEFRRWMMLVVGSGVLVILGELSAACLRRPPPLMLGIHRALTRAARHLSDESTIVFSAASMWVYAILLLLFSAWVGLQLHQSSIGMWDDLYATSIPDSGIRIGTPRAIRSDEWNTFTPWMLSQVQNGMNLDNPNLGATGSAVLTGAPLAGPLLLAQPKYWGFVFLDIGHGFSWFWAFKVFGLLGAFFTLLLALTRGDVAISLGGAIAIYGSSLNQWWFSGIAPELLMGFAMSVVGSLYLLQAKKSGGMAVGAVILAMVIPNLLMHIYPPHLLPLAYLAIFLVIGMMLRPDAIKHIKCNFMRRMCFFGISLAVLLYLVGVWYGLSAKTIQLMLNTAYPGKRFVLGGDLSWAYVFHGIFESWRIDEWPLPFPPSNQTAASQMWVLFPLALMLVPLRGWFNPRYRVPVVLLAYCLLVLAWTSLPLPLAVRQMMAHGGWSLSPPWNSIIGMGVASMILMCVLTAGVNRGDLVMTSWPKQLLPLTAGCMVLAYGFYLRSVDAEFFRVDRVVWVAVFMAIFAWTVQRGNAWWFLALCVLSAIPGLQVNPVRNDFDAYLNKDLFVQAKAAGGGPDDRWAVFGDVDIAQGFKSVGLTVVNGSHYAPRLQVLNVLDPTHRYENIWNRYAHVGYASGVAGGPPVFELKFPDQYQVALDVCGTELSALGVTRVAYSYRPSASEMRCLSPIPRARSEGEVFFYRLNSGVFGGN